MRIKPSSLSRLRPRSGYDVVAVLSMCVALGTGGAYAANTITSEDIVDETVTDADVKNGTLTGSDLKLGTVSRNQLAFDSVWSPSVLDGSLTTHDIANGAVTGADVDEATLGKVPSAASADKAPVKGAHVVEAMSNSASRLIEAHPYDNYEVSVTVLCDPGEVATGGAYWEQWPGETTKNPPIRAASAYHAPSGPSDRGSYFVRAEVKSHVDDYVRAANMLHAQAVCVDAGF